MTSNTKVVVITGASSGIGEHTAYAFAATGASLSLAARNKEKLVHVAETCKKLGATSVMIHSVDVTSEQACASFIHQTQAEFGGIDVLINNAGITMRALFNDATVEVIKKVMDTNFWGAVYCTHYAINSIIERKGSVIGISSIAGIKGLPGRTGYSASKFAMHGFLEALRTENLKKGLHVGIVCPGYTASNIRNTALNNRGESQSESPLDESKLMQPDEVARAIVNCVNNRKNTVVLTTQGKLTFWLSKFFPNWVDKMIYNVVANEKDSPFHP